MFEEFFTHLFIHFIKVFMNSSLTFFDSINNLFSLFILITSLEGYIIGKGLCFFQGHIPIFKIMTIYSNFSSHSIAINFPFTYPFPSMEIFKVQVLTSKSDIKSEISFIPINISLISKHSLFIIISKIFFQFLFDTDSICFKSLIFF